MKISHEKYTNIGYKNMLIWLNKIRLDYFLKILYKMRKSIKNRQRNRKYNSRKVRKSRSKYLRGGAAKEKKFSHNEKLKRY